MMKLEENYPLTGKSPEVKYIDLADKLTHLKRKLRFTTRALSLRSGVPVGTLNKILDGTTRNPSMDTIERIARAFQVSIRYFTDPVPQSRSECDIGAYIAEDRLIWISPGEMELIERYRELTDRGRRIASVVLETVNTMDPSGLLPTEGAVTLLVYSTRKNGCQGGHLSSLTARKVQVVASEAAFQADFAVELTGSGFEPCWKDGTILAVRSGPVQPGDVGVFLLNDEGFIRRLFEKKGIRKLLTLNREVPNITVEPERRLHHMGTVLGALTPIRPLQVKGERRCGFQP